MKCHLKVMAKTHEIILYLYLEVNINIPKVAQTKSMPSMCYEVLASPSLRLEYYCSIRIANRYTNSIH
jgi:hypothetical protein